jgi:hypothetical protein
MPAQILISETPDTVAEKAAADFADLVEKTLAGKTALRWRCRRSDSQVVF